MKISSQEEYGLRCLLQLAKAGPAASLSIADIAEKEGLSVPYTAKLLGVLRSEGFIESTLGRTGGYRLARPAVEIRLGLVINALGEKLFEEEEFCQKHSGTETHGNCVHNQDCNLRSLWQTLEGAMQHILNGLSIADLLNPKAPWLNVIQERLTTPMEPRSTIVVTPLGMRERITETEPTVITRTATNEAR
jgi:Rrf2 family protein